MNNFILIEVVCPKCGIKVIFDLVPDEENIYRCKCGNINVIKIEVTSLDTAALDEINKKRG